MLHSNINQLSSDEVLSFASSVSMILEAEKQGQSISQSVAMIHMNDTYIHVCLPCNLIVLIYSGKLDFICNYYGGRAWTDATKWSGQVIQRLFYSIFHSKYYPILKYLDTVQ